MSFNLDKIFQITQHPWIIGLSIFILTFVILNFITKFVWSRLKKLSSTSRIRWDESIIIKTQSSVQVLCVLIALLFSVEYFGVSEFFQKVFKGLFILNIIWVVERVITAVVSSRSINLISTRSSQTFILNIARVIVFSLGLLLVLDNIGISITPLLASLGVGSIAIALALQDTLSNFFSGVYILADKPVRIGDFIKLDNETEGEILKIGWRSTHIQLLTNNTVVIPNSKLASAQITNYNMPVPEAAFRVSVGVSYNSDLDQVERVTIAVATEVLANNENSVPGFVPFIRYHNFGESSIDFNVVMRVKKYTDLFALRHDFIKALHKKYKEENIEIPFPQRVVHMVSTSKEK
jgi:small-conductance mechanosensitive channel